MPPSKRDFEDIAAILNQTGKKYRGNAELLLEIAQHMAAHFETANPNFNRAQFISACFKYQKEG